MGIHFNPEDEIKYIIDFLQTVLEQTKKKGILVACSGGIDLSSVATLVANAVGRDKTYMLLMPYKNLNEAGVKMVNMLSQSLMIPTTNIWNIDISEVADTISKTLSLNSIKETIRLGNIMARIRMIILYDFAKKHDLLVCGTKNKSEYYLGYYTKYGDEASDIEPIRHLYKTQVLYLAEHLGIPEQIRKQIPTAGLWEEQTDEGEFGFSYKEADQVLYLYFDKNQPIDNIIAMGMKNAKRIIEWCERNNYKHLTPYLPYKKENK